MLRANNRMSGRGVAVSWLLGLAGVLFMCGADAADTPRTRGAVAKMVDLALPALITSSNADLVRRMVNAKFGKPIAQNLVVDASLKTLFGDQTPRLQPGCARKTTESGDPSLEECMASLGSLAGRGAYSEFAWDRNLGFGNLRYLRRDPDGTLTPGTIPALRMTDEQAFRQASAFLISTLGVPPEEIAPKLPGARLAFPVRTLVLGANGPRGKISAQRVMKLVKIPRSVEMELPTPVGGVSTLRIKAPGEAAVLLNNGGVWLARVKDWTALRISPLVDPANAKSRAELIDEITDRIMEEDAASIVAVRARLVINEPDPAALGLLLPAVRQVRDAAARMPGIEVSITPVARDPTESQQALAGLTTAGHVHQIALVRLPEAKTVTDD